MGSTPDKLRRWTRFVSASLTVPCFFWAAGAAYAQSPSEMPQVATRAVQLPLSGRSPEAGDVTTTQRTTNSGGSNSVVSVDSVVIVPSPYNGSAANAKATNDVLRLSLGEALRIAFKANLGALSQSAMEQQARGQRAIAKSELLPQLNTVISEVYEKENLRTTGLKTPTIPSISTFNYYDARAVRLNQSVFDLVRIRNLQGADKNVEASIKAARNARDLIVLAVAGSYLQLLATGARADAAAAQVVTFGAINKQAEDRLDAGLATRVDALRAKVQLQTQQQRLRSLEADVETQKLKLSRMVGLPLGQPFVPTDLAPFSPVTDFAQDEALVRAQRNRSDLQAADSSVKAAELTVSAAHAERAPSVAVIADFGAAGTTPTNHSVGVYTVSGTLTIPLYQGGRIHADQEVAKAALRQRTAERDDVRGQVDQDVRQAFIDLNRAADQVGIAESNRQMAHEVLTQSTDRFIAGVADSVEFVQSEQTLVQADDDYITAVFDHNLAKVELARAMGNAEQTLPQLLRKP